MSEITPNVATLPVSETSEKAKPDAIAGPVSGHRAIWNRAVLLLGALCLIKLLMIFGLRKHLFETHWRVGPEPITWVNYVAFYVFALMAGLNLWRFAGHCERGGVRVVRGANACVLMLGALFILLTFSEQGYNYLCAIINSYLDLKDLRWYLFMNFCFRWPYLAVWVIGYALAYYLMVRKGKEHLVLRATAICATAYLALGFNNLWYREIVTIAGCVGLTMFLAGRNAKGSLNPVVPGLLLMFMAFFFVLFRGYDSMLTWHWMNREFFILWTGSLVLFAGITAVSVRRGFYVGWSWLLPFAFTTFLLFANTNYLQAHNYVNFLCVGLTLPRYFLSEIGITLAWFCTAWIYRRMRPAGSLLWLDVVLILIIVFGVLDLRLTQIMGVRLDWQVLSLALGETPKMMWRMSRPYLPALALAVGVMVAIYAGLLVMLQRVSTRVVPAETANEDRELAAPRFCGAKWLLLGLVLLGLAGSCLFAKDKVRGQALTLLATTSPMWQHAASPVMDVNKFNKTARELGIWQLPDKGAIRSGGQAADRNVPPASGSAHDMNLIMIFQESTYNKHLSLFDGTNDTEPLLSKYKDRMELFPNFYSSFAGSINARFATFTGLYPVSDFNAFTTHHVPVKSLFEVLHENGYSNSLFYSSFFDYTGFRDFLRGRDLDEMYDADTMPGRGWIMPVAWGLREDETMGAITNQIKKYAASKQKFCLTYVPAAPHNPFDGTPKRFDKFPRGDPDDFTGPYLNELLFMDWIVSSIVDQLKDSGLLENTLIMITGDHGELLGEKGGLIGHGWLLTPELANVPLILINPKRPGYHINDTVGSQVDVLPTMLDLLGLPLPAGQLYQGVSLYSADASVDRTIYLNTFQQYGIIQSGRWFCGSREQNFQVDGPLGFYSFTNEGARTIFQPLDRMPPGETNSLPSISDFDRFQGNFLRNYSDYCRMARQTAGK